MDDAHRRVVVGVDGSAAADRALEWAAAEAEGRGAELCLLLAYTYPPVPVMGGASLLPPLELEEAARDVLDERVSAARGAHPRLRTSPLLVLGPPGPALVRAAHDADLLVVGTRGHGNVAGLLLGSVAQYCAHHAPCPVVVVPGDRRGDGGPAGR